LKKLAQSKVYTYLCLSTMPRKKVIIDSAYVMQLKMEGLKKLCAKHKLSKKGRKAELQKRVL